MYKYSASKALWIALDGLEAKNKLATKNIWVVQGVTEFIRIGIGSEYNARGMIQEGIMVRILSEFFSYYIFHSFPGHVYLTLG